LRIRGNHDKEKDDYIEIRIFEIMEEADKRIEIEDGHFTIQAQDPQDWSRCKGVASDKLRTTSAAPKISK